MSDHDPEALLAHTGWLRALARTLVADGAAADDLVQDAFVVALERGGAPRDLRKWCAGVLRNLARTRRRADGRRTARERGAAAGEARDERSALARADLQRRLIELVLELDEPYRTTLVLRFFEELSLEEIARRAGVPSSTVRTRVARGLERLRARLDDEHAGERGAWCVALAPFAGEAGRGALATTLAWGGLGMGLQARAAIVAGVVVAGALVWRGLGGGADARVGGERGSAAPAESVAGLSPREAEAEAAVAADADAAREPAMLDAVREPAVAPEAASAVGVLVYGSVLGDNGTRVEGGRIAFVDEQARMLEAGFGAAGTYAVFVDGPGTQHVSVRCRGYLDGACEVVVPEGVETLRQDLALARALAIPVRFLDAPAWARDHLGVVATLDPPPPTLPGADGMRYAGNAAGTFFGRSRTRNPDLAPEDDGMLYLRVPPPVWISVVLRGTVLETRRIEGPVDRLELTVRDAEARLGGLRLRVLDARTGAALPGARVALNYRDRSSGGTAVGADGRIELLEEAPGLRRLEVHAGEGASLRRWIRIEPGAVLELGDVAVEPRTTVSGRVVDERGRGVSTELTWFALDAVPTVRDVQTNRLARSRTDGTFRVDAAQGRLVFVVTGDEWASGPVIVDASQGNAVDVEVRVSRGAEVRLRPAAGSEGARLTLATAAGLAFWSRPIDDVPIATRLAEGRYEVWLGWDEHVQTRMPLVVPAEAQPPLVVDLPALEAAR